MHVHRTQNEYGMNCGGILLWLLL